MHWFPFWYVRETKQTNKQTNHHHHHQQQQQWPPHTFPSEGLLALARPPAVLLLAEAVTGSSAAPELFAGPRLLVEEPTSARLLATALDLDRRKQAHRRCYFLWRHARVIRLDQRIPEAVSATCWEMERSLSKNRVSTLHYCATWQTGVLIESPKNANTILKERFEPGCCQSWYRHQK